MSDQLPPTGFWSYSRDDDRRSRGRLSQLRALVSEELQGVLGRRGGVQLFQDVTVFEYGDLWPKKIADTLGGCSFLIPILTPDFFQSEWCCEEVRLFLTREAEIGRGSMIFPIRFLDIAGVDPEDPKQVRDREIWDRMLITQQVDYGPLRHSPPKTSLKVQQLVADLAKRIAAALEQVAQTKVDAPVLEATTKKPSWASASGTDQYGTWADISVPGPRNRTLMQRLRLIQSGAFVMGSRDDEPGRFVDEGPVHEVTIRQPFWLFDTPCTQAFWEAVMGENPSALEEPDHPVETVNYGDVTAFIRKLNNRTRGLNLTLPSEVQWEYACRAGSVGPRYAEPVDAVGWYAGNSGGHSHPVKQLRPNDWGLFDMLGNVWEWCADGASDSYDGTPTDGSARPASEGARRVLRGGSWRSIVRSLRAASRNNADPLYRASDFGFRCARVQVAG